MRAVDCQTAGAVCPGDEVGVRVGAVDIGTADRVPTGIRPVDILAVDSDALNAGAVADSFEKGTELLKETGLAPSLLELEVTEDILLRDEERVLGMFKRIQELGVRVLFDDFGTGYASLSYLKKFPLDGLKIDRSFVLDLLADSDDAAIVSSTVGLSKQLGLSVVAEGIENRATADFLVSMGCEEGQGYFFGRAMPVEAFERQFLMKQDSSHPVREAVSAA